MYFVFFLNNLGLKFCFSQVTLGRKHDFLFSLMVNKEKLTHPNILGSNVAEKISLNLLKQKELSHWVYQTFVSNWLKSFIWNFSWLRILPDLESAFRLWAVFLFNPYMVLCHLQLCNPALCLSLSPRFICNQNWTRATFPPVAPI